MSILIKGMDMPTDTYLALNIYPDGRVAMNLDANCATAVSIPTPHGDLIDRYDLKHKEITIDYYEQGDTFQDGLLFVADLIDNAPTIIEAEEDT